MVTTFHIDSSDLDEEIVKKIRSVYNNKRILLTVEEDDDTSSYLLSTRMNREKFARSISELESGNLVVQSIDDLRK
jgi:hypothetical protein